MVRFASFVAVLVTLGVTVGAPLSPSDAATEKDEQGSHGRRTFSNKVYCDSFDCPYGYSLIDDADEERCKRGMCETSQCCEMNCLRFECLFPYHLIDDAETTVCESGICSKNQCCNKYE